MAKANKSIFKALVQKTTHTYEYIEDGVDRTFDFDIRQLTVGDIADITSDDNKDGDYLLIARSLDETLENVYDIPVPALKGLIDKIVEFNDLSEIYDKTA